MGGLLGRTQRGALVVEDGAAEAAQQPGDILADGAEADDADGLAAEHVAGLGQLRGAPLVVLQRVMAPGQVAQQADHQAEGEFGDRHRIAAGGARHDHALGAGGVEIEIVDADTPFVQQPGARRRRQQGGVDGDLAGDDEIRLGDDLLQMRGVAVLRMLELHALRQQPAHAGRGLGGDRIEHDDLAGHTCGLVPVGRGGCILWHRRRTADRCRVLANHEFRKSLSMPAKARLKRQGVMA